MQYYEPEVEQIAIAVKAIIRDLMTRIELGESRAQLLPRWKEFAEIMELLEQKSSLSKEVLEARIALIEKDTDANT